MVNFRYYLILRDLITIDKNKLKTILQKLLSLELSINNVWDRSNADSLRFSLTLMSHDEPVSFLSYVNVLSDPRRYVPSGILLKSNQNDAVYFDENDADLIQRTDINSNDILHIFTLKSLFLYILATLFAQKQFLY